MALEEKISEVLLKIEKVKPDDELNDKKDIIVQILKEFLKEQIHHENTHHSVG